MNFTNSPYERMMKEIPHKDIPAPQKAPEGTPCAGCPYWRGIGCVFCYREHLPALGWIGRHALIIYLAHQPVVYGVLWIADWLL